jgi:ABC-type sulfate transport system substrate-binding protein
MILEAKLKKLITGAALAAALLTTPAFAQPTDILNVSYDIGRELYEAVNVAFVPKYKADTGCRPDGQPVACRLVGAGARRSRRPRRPISSRSTR